MEELKKTNISLHSVQKAVILAGDMRFACDRNGPISFYHFGDVFQDKIKKDIH